jgi:4-hydroxy-3-methylbut-2-enyl diphosphate reductase IspH
VQLDAEAKGLPVIDATCPLVSKVHAQGRRYVATGRTLVLIGHAGHPEVEGTLGQIDGEVHLVGSPQEVATLDLPLDRPIAYITQTTLSVDDTRAMGKPAFLVADGSEVNPAWLDGIDTIGLTAGASAPEELVQSVIAAIERIAPATVSTLDGLEENVQFRLPPALARLQPRARVA